MSFGAFNDNFFRQALIALVAFGGYGFSQKEMSVFGALGSALLVVPFFLFSGVAGALADSFRKSTVVKYAKAAELFLMLLAAALFYHGYLYALLGVLFLMGVQSAFFGPVKYSILPEILEERSLVLGNGVVEGLTFVMIVLGAALGSFLAGLESGRILSPLVLVSAAALGLLAALRQPPSEKIEQFVPMQLNPWRSTGEILAVCRKRGDVWLSVLAVSWFWMLGSVLLTQMPVLCSSVLGAESEVATLMVSTFALGVAAGSLSTQLLTKGEVSARLVPASSLFLTLLLFAFAFSVSALPRAGEGTVTLNVFLSRWVYLRLLFSAFLVSFAAGLFVVPLNALVQHRSSFHERSRAVAGLNVMNSLFMVGGAVLVLVMTACGLSLAAVFFFLAGSAGVVSILTLYFLPDESLRQLAKVLIFLLYRPEIRGVENLKLLEGRGALIVPNHASFLDVALLVCHVPEKLSFAINADWARAWWVRPFLRFFRAVPVKFSSPRSVRILADILKEGGLLVLFPEGRVTTTGSLMKIYDGAALVAKLSGAPLAPVAIDGAEFTVFGRLRKRLRNPPRRFKVRMTFFPPVEEDWEPRPGESRRAQRARWGVRLHSLMAEKRFQTRNTDKNLFQVLLERKKTEKRGRVMVQDAAGSALDYGGLVKTARFFGGALKNATQKGEMVGVLLPNSNAALALLFGIWARGAVCVMLNHSQGRAALETALTAARVKTVVTSRAFLEAIGRKEMILGLSARILFLEDLDRSFAKRVSSLFFRPEPLEASAPAAVVFTSGSEGKPKGVALSHRNILSDIHQAMCLIEINRDDRLFNAMPAFHAFGLNIGMLLPPLAGLSSFNYPTPLHVKTIPELIYDYEATVVIATDTFARAWGLNAHPYDFHSVRYMILGAEKVREETMELYRRKLSLRLFEGYGVSEASPIAAVNSKMRARDGSVGVPLPGMDWRLEPVPGVEKGGRLFIKGPNVMLGYLSAEAPGVLIPPPEGWHDTGDVAEVDADGFLWIKGRYKRFAKIAGEMLSLAAVEDALAQSFPGSLFAVLSVPDETRGEKLLLAFRGEAPEREALRGAILSQGLSELSVPKSVLSLPELPLTPLGKVNLPKLGEIVREKLGN
jgi:acyl-[acyl-carrier-protein]-phospholipid O-acyltransferase/long-chain-fatty-acid--[acyl-carrier-protein] ligase